MIPVCKDVEADGVESFWFYAKGFYVKMVAGKERAKISGEFLPDPVELWRGRCDAAGKPMGTPESDGARLKPTAATFKLFEHWGRLRAAQGAA